MDNTFRIHPAIGMARVGNSEEYLLAPETMAGRLVREGSSETGGLPIKPGTEADTIRSSDLRDEFGALKRQAARFRIFHYPGGESETWPTGQGAEVTIGTVIDGKTVADIIWSVHVANKKANTFVLVEDGDRQGIAGYGPGPLPPIRNPDIRGRSGDQPGDPIAVLNDPDRVRKLTIDPGPRTISGSGAAAVRFDART
jgi:L-lysine epsilon oxidase-like protein